MTRMQTIEIEDDIDSVEDSSLRSRVIKTLGNMATISEVLRFGGAAIVVASMSSFIMHDWGRANDIQNYFMLLMQSVLLVGAGFAMSYGLKENKGARVFFGLGLISVSANFTILGALIYSVVPLDITFVQYPGYAHWVATSPKMLLMGVGAALFVLLPITYFGMSVMSKYRPAQLGIAYLLMNSLLLLPLRDPGYVGLIGLASLIVLSMATRRYFTSQDHLQTPGSTFVKGLLYLPIGIMLGRTVLIYQPDAILALSVSMMIYLSMKALSRRPKIGQTIRKIGQASAYIASLSIAVASANIANQFLAEVFWLPVFASVLVAVSCDLLRSVAPGNLFRAIRFLTASIFTLSFTLNMTTFDSSLASLMGLLAGLSLLSYAWIQGRRLFMVFGLIIMFFGLRYQLESLIELFFRHSWVSLAIIGSCTIVLASVIERHGAVIKLKITHSLAVAKKRGS